MTESSKTLSLLLALCALALVSFERRGASQVDMVSLHAESKPRIAVVAGSMREQSYGRMLAQELGVLAEGSSTLVMIDIRDLPMYNPDLDDDPPLQWRRFREELAATDAVLFITPEYNRSVPAVIKNAIDVGSRPHGHGAMAGKPAAVISFTTGRLGGFGAHHHLRQSLVVLNMPVMPTPEAYIGNIDQLFDKHGKITDPSTRRFLKGFLTSFERWISYH